MQFLQLAKSRDNGRADMWLILSTSVKLLTILSLTLSYQWPLNVTTIFHYTELWISQFLMCNLWNIGCFVLCYRNWQPLYIVMWQCCMLCILLWKSRYILPSSVCSAAQSLMTLWQLSIILLEERLMGHHSYMDGVV